jgi:hypothetical protein
MNPAPEDLAEPHPVLFPHTREQAEALYRAALKAGEPGLAPYAEWLLARRRLMSNAEDNPLVHGWVPPSWQLVDQALDKSETVALFGANRTTKSWWAGHRFCEAAWNYPGGTLVALAEKEQTSIATQQKIIWHFLRYYIEKFNRRQATGFKVAYSTAGGFTEGKIVLPNGMGRVDGTEIYCLTYKQLAKDYEGWEFGAKVKELKQRADGTVIPNIGWWADESLTIQWLETLTRRGPFRQAKGVWTFTPKDGITPAIKEFLGAAPVVLEDAPAELLPAARIPGCRAGHMPVVVQPKHPKARAIYFHLGANPFGDYTNQVKALCRGKHSEYVERIAYGYARDAVGRAFTRFGPHNIVPEQHLPAVGTNYMVCDPAESRPFFALWVRVTPGDKPDYYIYRDWPDEQTYGEWAVAYEGEISEDAMRGWDGAPGPAQGNYDGGVTGFKREWYGLETVRPGGGGSDPYRKKLQAQADKSGVAVRETIEERLIDSRAAPRPHIENNGQTCVLWQFAEQHTDGQGGGTLEPMEFRVASGERIDLNIIKELLDYDTDAAGRITRPPRLYVSERCKQVIWALSNYTGRSGERGASKDPVDCLRYMASGNLEHVTPEMWQIRRNGVEE